MTIERCTDLGLFFRACVEEAMRARRASLGEATAEYVAGLLTSCTDPRVSERLGGSLVLQLEAALREGVGDAPSGEALRAVGDAALCRSGLFGAEGALRVCVRVGAFAYREAASRTKGEGHGALVELGEAFPVVVDVVAEVAEATALGAVTRDLVRLYDRWREADSERALQAMAERGVFPGRGGGEG